MRLSRESSQNEATGFGRGLPRSVSERGYNLIEVLLGMALLAIVAITITGLFVRGRQDVQAGGNLSVALALAQHVAEDLDSLSYVGQYSLFGISETTSEARIQVREDGLTELVATNRDPLTWALVGSVTPGAAGAAPVVPVEPAATLISVWADELTDLPGTGTGSTPYFPRIEIHHFCYFDVDSDGTLIADDRATFEGAAIIRTDITIYWKEGERPRWVSIPQTRTFNQV